MTCINTVVGMAVDLERKRPVFPRGTAGYSGPGIKPVALAKVWQVAQAVRIPIVGIGGIDYDLASQADGFAFWLQFALGIKRQIGDRTALTGDVRLYHISNAGLTPPNAGIDMIAFTLGIETP